MEFYEVFKSFQRCSVEFQWGFQGVPLGVPGSSRKLQRYSRAFYGGFRGVSSGFRGVSEYSSGFPGTPRAFKGF